MTVDAGMLTLPALNYIAACAADNDVYQLQEMQVPRTQATALKELGGFGRRRLAVKAITKRCLTIRIDVLVLHKLIEYIGLYRRSTAQFQNAKGSKEGLLTLAALHYMQACMASQDIHSLRRLNLVYRDIEAVQRLRLDDAEGEGNVADLLLSLHNRCVSIKANQVLLDTALKTLHDEICSQETIIKAIAGGATKTMMRKLTGLSAREYADYRMLLGLSPRPGRLKQPDRPAIGQLHRHFKSLSDHKVRLPLPLAEYVSTSEATGIPVGVIWNISKHWHM